MPAAAASGKQRDYDYLFKLVLIGDSGVGKSCLLLRFAVSPKRKKMKIIAMILISSSSSISSSINDNLTPSFSSPSIIYIQTHRTMHSRNRTSPPSASTSASEQSRSTRKQSNYKSGIQPAKNDSEQSHPPTTEEPTV